ncbi:hypothetical protein BH09PAT2_BH09PAT2_07210 [soil metagenome]
MLTIICGEDISASRNELQALKKSYQKKGYSVKNVTASELPEIQKSNEGVVDLFGQESIYAVENLSSLYKGRGKTDYKTTIDELSKNQKLHVIDWENGKSAYELTTIKKLAHSFHEAKPSQSIFQLLDSTVPGDVNRFISILHLVNETQDSMFIYTLLWRHVRKLILAADGIFDKKTSPWQKTKLQSQVRTWKKEKLVSFYEGLVKIDFGMKTSSSTFDVRESIEILACYYLK